VPPPHAVHASGGRLALGGGEADVGADGKEPAVAGGATLGEGVGDGAVSLGAAVGRTIGAVAAGVGWTLDEQPDTTRSVTAPARNRPLREYEM
jgi:hypothetical protein